MKGNVLGIETYPGAKNLIITSFVSIYKGFIPHMNSGNRIETNLIFRRLTTSGSTINPCNDTFGVVLGGINCDQIKPLFNYLGYPFRRIGWINIEGADLRQYVSMGPFKLIANTPVDILISHACFRDTDSTSSVRSGKIHSAHLQQFYLSNFTSIQSSVENENKILIDRYQLYQNYPNPFNPKTKIKYSLPSNKFVTLKIFDVVGRELITLVNANHNICDYEIEFNASKYNFSSGLYFYQFKAGNFVQTKKMILLK